MAQERRGACSTSKQRPPNGNRRPVGTAHNAEMCQVDGRRNVIDEEVEHVNS